MRRVKTHESTVTGPPRRVVVEQSVYQPPHNPSSQPWRVNRPHRPHQGLALFYDGFGYSGISHYFVVLSTISISSWVKLCSISLVLGGLCGGLFIGEPLPLFREESATAKHTCVQTLPDFYPSTLKSHKIRKLISRETNPAHLYCLTHFFKAA
jgi:hypothetical protein